jgi:hypothetical protein
VQGAEESPNGLLVEEDESNKGFPSLLRGGGFRNGELSLQRRSLGICEVYAGSRQVMQFINRRLSQTQPQVLRYWVLEAASVASGQQNLSHGSKQPSQSILDEVPMFVGS